MDQEDLIHQITISLQQHPEVGAAFLGGSHGREEADALSDVDVYVVVADSKLIQETLTKLANSVSGIAPIVYSKVLPNARTINCITDGWLRFDFTVVTDVELGFLAGGCVKLLFDNVGISDAVNSVAPSMRQRDADELLNDVSEFIRILGLSVVVKKRDDLLVAQTGTNLMRDILIRVMLHECRPQPQRGVLALNRSLTPTQRAELAQLPVADANWSAVYQRTKAIASAFFPRAYRLANNLNAQWPDEFERVTKKYLSEEIGLEI